MTFCSDKLKIEFINITDKANIESLIWFLCNGNKVLENKKEFCSLEYHEKHKLFRFHSMKYLGIQL